MKDTIKNSIIGAFAIFGFISLISSFTENKELNNSLVSESLIGKYQLQINPTITDNSTNGYVVIDTETGDIYEYEQVWDESSAEMRDFYTKNEIVLKANKK